MFTQFPCVCRFLFWNQNHWINLMAHACAEESRRENAREKARERIRIRYFLSQMSGSAKKLTLSTLLFFCTQQVCAILFFFGLFFLHACWLFIFFPFSMFCWMSNMELSQVVLVDIILTFSVFVYGLNSDLPHTCFFHCPKCSNLLFSWPGTGYANKHNRLCLWA